MRSTLPSLSLVHGSPCPLCDKPRREDEFDFREHLFIRVTSLHGRTERDEAIPAKILSFPPLYTQSLSSTSLFLFSGSLLLQKGLPFHSLQPVLLPADLDVLLPLLLYTGFNLLHSVRPKLPLSEVSPMPGSEAFLAFNSSVL